MAHIRPIAAAAAPKDANMKNLQEYAAAFSLCCSLLPNKIAFPALSQKMNTADSLGYLKVGQVIRT